jgi:hypothetical protein
MYGLPTPTVFFLLKMSSFVSLINGRDVTLNWTTTSETNNSHFEIERSLVNGQWSMVGSVQAVEQHYHQLIILLLTEV